jgi:hypothetical protein
MKFRTILLGLAALFISFNAAYFSVSGLAKLFAGGGLAIIIMASSLELGKLIGASYLYSEWKIITLFQKIYLTSAIVILIGITSMGIYGYLTAAYQTTASALDISEKQIELVELKKERWKTQLADYNSEKNQLTETINNLSTGLANNVIQYKDKETGEIITTTSSSTRRALQSELDDSKIQRTELNDKIQVANDSITKFDIEVFSLQSGDELAAEVGPLKFISELTGWEMTRIVNILTLLIIFVFDPLAVMLIVSFNQAMKSDRGEKDKKRAMKNLKVYGEGERPKSITKKEQEKLLQQMIRDAEDMGLYDEPILKTEEDKEIFLNEIENPSMPNDALLDASKKYNETKLKNIEVIDSEEIKPIDEDGDGKISEQEIRNAYEKGGWRNPSPSGGPYYTHPWFDWSKSERWVNNTNAVDYWKQNRAGTQRALEEYRKNYPTDFSSKTY